jgi:hypothetical protein
MFTLHAACAHSRLAKILLDSTFVAGREKSRVRRFKIVCNMTLSPEAVRTLGELATEAGCSRSKLLCDIFACNHARLFELFMQGKTFVDVVLATKYPPHIVRHAYREFRAGYTEPEAGALEKRIELAQVRLETAETVARSKERRALIRHRGVLVKSEAMVRAERVRAVVSNGRTR